MVNDVQICEGMKLKIVMLNIVNMFDKCVYKVGFCC